MSAGSGSTAAVAPASTVGGAAVGKNPFADTDLAAQGDSDWIAQAQRLLLRAAPYGAMGAVVARALLQCGASPLPPPPAAGVAATGEKEKCLETIVGGEKSINNLPFSRVGKRAAQRQRRRPTMTALHAAA